ncbi:MAG: CPBP family intramembrane metalloprotease [Thermoleophilia bacterium]|nr:CPBP family intramembrane metalloprotease [Thermoleophilia bacterium]
MNRDPEEYRPPDPQTWDLLTGRPPEKPGPGPGRVPWTALDILVIVLLVPVVLFLLSAMLGALLGLASAVTDVDLIDRLTSPLANSLFWLLQWTVTLGIAFSYFRIRGYRLNMDVIGFRRTRFWPAAVMMVIVMAVAGILQGIYVQFIEPEQPAVTELFGESIISFVVAMVIVAILTPVIEEMFFRGIIHQGLEQRYGFWPGALLSSAVFALAHIDPTVYIPIFVLGFGFAFLMSYTKSVWPAVAAHLLWNTLGVIVQFFPPEM